MHKKCTKHRTANHVPIWKTFVSKYGVLNCPVRGYEKKLTLHNFSASGLIRPISYITNSLIYGPEVYALFINIYIKQNYNIKSELFHISANTYFNGQVYIYIYRYIRRWSYFMHTLLCIGIQDLKFP